MSLLETMQNDGQLPKISLEILSLEDANAPAGIPGSLLKVVASTNIEFFLGYEFNSNVLVPVDQFNFSFAAPSSFTEDGDLIPVTEVFREGDIVYISIDDEKLACGRIDSVDIEVTADRGEIVTIHGRDFIGMLEDQDAISVSFNSQGVINSAKPIYAENVRDINVVLKQILEGTRIPGTVVKNSLNVPPEGFLFATEPTETKLAALQRFLEPFNVIFWANEEGQLVIGKPDMQGGATNEGDLYCIKSRRESNVLDIKATYSSSQIANVIIPIYSGNEKALQAFTQNAVLNNAPGPDRLRRLGSVMQKVVTVSNPNGADAQSLSQVNDVALNGRDNSTLSKYANREMARQNQKEIIVQVTVPGHINENGNAYRANTKYFIRFEQADIDETMYCFEANYMLDDQRGAMTRLSFCRLKTICAEGSI